MQCLRCLNNNPALFYKGSRGYYCRSCIKFKRILLQEEEKEISYITDSLKEEAFFKYPLTSYQKEAALKAIKYLKQGHNTVLNCITGAGKTEIAALCIAYFLAQNKKVAYAIPRREVVIELTARFKEIFPSLKIVSIYGGHSSNLYGDLIICTTHQLYRYHKAFDLLVIDETDAFPYADDPVLKAISFNAGKGLLLYSTATLDPETLKDIKDNKLKEVYLPLRPHLRPLIEPKLLFLPAGLIYLFSLFYLFKPKRQLFVFVPRKKDVKLLKLLLFYRKDIAYVYSDIDQRAEAISSFKENKKKIIITTSLLERGVTVKNADVCIFVLCKDIFNEAAYIQMAGRAGRDYYDTEGKCLIVSAFYDRTLFQAIKKIKEANRAAMSILSKTN